MAPRKTTKPLGKRLGAAMEKPAMRRMLSAPRTKTLLARAEHAIERLEAVLEGVDRPHEGAAGAVLQRGAHALHQVTVTLEKTLHAAGRLTRTASEPPMPRQIRIKGGGHLSGEVATKAARAASPYKGKRGQKH